ncbi:meckelin [Belonocnema kinseyi]|uniref:meckelin n=1 Tax=Belonocnema kinseyi TaxID=2817044 RepID=UPI00143CCEF3|nr:meckelin [Belonocnema kinseyi]
MYYKFRFFIFHFLILLILNRTLELSSEIIEYILPDDCKVNEYFDGSSLSCIQCEVEKNLEPSENRLTCECNKKSRLIGFKNGFPICELCKPGTIPTSDGKNCIPCKKNNETLACSCSANQIRVERNLTGELLETVECLPCSINAYPSTDGKCLPCNDIKYSKLTKCNCPPESHMKINQYCFPKNYSYWPELYNSYFVNFQNESIESYYLRMNLQLATYLCKDENKTECENLTNMCALTLYANEAACNVLRLKPDSLFYKQEEAFSVVNSRNISQQYNLYKNSNKSKLHIKVVKYSLEGTFESIDVPYIFKMLLNIRFGVNTHKQQKLMAKELKNMKMEFLEPYLVYNDESKQFLHPLPILVKQINKNIENVSEWQLVKRFFLVDSVTGLQTIKNSLNGSFQPDFELSGLRYLKSLEIIINVQSKEDRGKILPPLLIIHYEEITQKQILNDEEVLIDVKVSFVVPEQDVKKVVQITVAILSTFAVMLSILKTWSYYKRNFAKKFDVSLLLCFLLNCMSFIGNVLLLVSMSTCICAFIFYKGQTVLHIPLPNKADEMTIHICTIMAFCFKTVELIANLRRQWNVNLIFIDWEQPKSIYTPMEYCSPRTSLRKLFKNKLKVIDENGSERKKTKTPSKSRRKSEDGISSSRRPEVLPTGGEAEQKNLQKTPVSIWRSFFIVNEFYKIQTKRRISIMFQIVSTLFVLEVFGLKNWSIAVPELSIKNNCNAEMENNYTLRYGTGALVYVSLYMIQWLASISFYETYVRNRIHRFVDLCSTANISLFIFYFKYYGFYIHGRSVHGFADTDFETLMNDLKREEKNLCAHKGLIPGTIEQTFTVSVSTNFREIFDETWNLQNTEEKRFLRKQYIRALNWEKTIMVHVKIKKFLMDFIDHCFKDLDYVVKDKLFLEKLCDMERPPAGKSVFYRDNSHSFDCTAFYGSEWMLGTFEIALFVFVQALSENYVISLLINFIVSQFLMIINKWNVKRNLTKNTLIDNKFLM